MLERGPVLVVVRYAEANIAAGVSDRLASLALLPTCCLFLFGHQKAPPVSKHAALGLHLLAGYNNVQLKLVLT